MAGKAGVWVDHRLGIIVILDDDQPRVMRIEAGIDDRVHGNGDTASSPSHEHRLIASENRRQGRVRHHQRRFYRAIASVLLGCDSILVLGQNKTRNEVRRFIVDAHPHWNIPAVFTEPAERLTERQLIARVRRFFNKGSVSAPQTQITIVATSSLPGHVEYGA